MDIKVAKDGALAEPVSAVEEPTPGAPTEVRSARRNIQEMRKNILDNLYLELKVPRWHVEDADGTFDVYVRYAPVRSAKVDQSLKRRSAQEHLADEASLLIHVDVLVDSCRGVFSVLNDDMDNKYTLKLLPDGTPDEEPTTYWTKFDSDLGATLGLKPYEAKLAENICRALYFTDGDIIDASTRLSTWSAQTNEEAEKDFTQP